MKAAAFAVTLLLASMVTAGCFEKESEAERRAKVFRGPGPGTMVQGMANESAPWRFAACSLSAIVTVVPMQANTSYGAYVLDDVRDEFPNARFSTAHTPAMGVIQGHVNAIFQCEPAGAGSAMEFVLYGPKVIPPSWDASGNDTDHFVLRTVAASDPEFSKEFVAQTGFPIASITTAGRQPVASDAYRMFYDVTGTRDMDALAWTPAATDAWTGSLRFWTDRRVEDEVSGRFWYQPVALTFEVDKAGSATRFDNGLLTVRDTFVQSPVFYPNQAAAQGMIVETSDVDLRLNQEVDVELAKTYYE